MSPRYRLLGSFALIALTLISLRGVVECGFINLDDPDYLQDNPIVLKGFTPEGIRSAFTDIQAGYWIPLTWISLQLDYSLTGPSPGTFHRTNLLLHTASVVLLFLLLLRMTSCAGRSFVVAALFAVHPLQVELVAWITERKDVLSTLFWMLALYAYARYAEKPGVGRYLLVALWLALGLLAKPMLVTLPCVLLLLDYWPLGRMRFSPPADLQPEAPAREEASPRSRFGLPWLIAEKLPLFALALGMGLVTILAQQQGNAVRSFEEFPLGMRINNALVSYVLYLGKLFWPMHLGVFYPHPETALAEWQVGGAALVLLAITVACVLLARRQPWLIVGWLWFLGTLAPVSGLMQAGWQGMADRFAYVPSIGVFLAVVWGVASLLGSVRVRAAGVLAALVLLGCVVRTMQQVPLWKDSLTLWQHTLAITPSNFTGHCSYGAALLDADRIDEAVEQFVLARHCKPTHGLPHYFLGVARFTQNRPAEAYEHASKALTIDPQSARTHWLLGKILAARGQMDRAEEHFAEARRLEPNNPRFLP